MEELHNAAKIAFATSFSFYLKAHNFHWNVEGEDFLEYHDLFGKIYED
jgi:DNA-binding ferritin-like protein